MENFTVSALKYRPNSFENVIGQSSITKTLENAIQNNQLPQAMLFCGPRGVGKTTCARILAKQINNSDQILDYSYNIFELDAASNNGVDDIRNLIDQVRIPPQTGHYKVYIIDEVHMLSGQAFNAFLKTLEEPPNYAIFILATTEKHKVIPTILSRCQIYDFKKINIIDIKNHLESIAKKENISYDEDSLFLIASKCDGALRDALSIFDRLVNFTDGNITKDLAYKNLNILDHDTYFKATDLILKNDITNCLVLFNNIINLGFNGQHFIDGLCMHFRDLLISKSSESQNLLEQNINLKNLYIEQSNKVDNNFLLSAITLSEDCSFRYKNSINQRLLTEICLMKLCSINNIELKKKIKILSKLEISNIPSKPYNKVEINDRKLTASIEIEKKSSFKKNIIPKTDISGLSLSSLKAKKYIQSVVLEKKKEEKSSKIKNSKIDQKSLEESWNKFQIKINNSGRKNLASILSISKPELKEKNKIEYTLTNNTSRLELNKNIIELIDFLKKDLTNDNISIEIKINKLKEKQLLYTPIEKYEKLKNINPNIEILRKEFKLNL
ncbi:MAG: DNA polymerase III subunit gamma/tau [Flavobacteriaceae bacterium]|nr:DNA polymerase III subunit gamma/tau [Flavobacteriaceae bacterium]